MADNSVARERKRKGFSAWPYLLIFVILSIGIGLAAHLYYFRQKARIVGAENDALSAVADLKVREISQWIEERKEDGQAVLENPFIAESIRRLIESPRPLREQRDAILGWMESLVRIYHYSGVAVFAPEGTVVLRTGRAAPSSLSPGERDLLRAAEREGQAVLSDLQRNEPGGGIFMDALIPIRRPAARNPGAAGYLILRIDPAWFFYPLIQSWPTPSRTSETLLVRREGDQVLYLNELRHRKNTALNLSFPLGANSLPATMAVQGKEGIVEGVDYRGVPVMAAVRHIPDSPWFLVAKVDRDEVSAPLRRQATLLFLVCFGLIFAAGGGMTSLLRRQQLMNLRRLQTITAERLALSKHYEYLTKYANDIILLVDGQGRMVEANDRAVEVYGYSREELFQLGLNDIRSPDASGAVEEISQRLQDRGALVFESVHVRKDGTAFPVEVSGRSIDIEGKKYYQEIIRDISDRKSAERKLREQFAILREVMESAGARIFSLDADFRYTSFNSEHAAGMKAVYGVDIEIGKNILEYMAVLPKSRDQARGYFEHAMQGKRVVVEASTDDAGPAGQYSQITHTPIRDPDGRVVGIVAVGSDITERTRMEAALRTSERLYRSLFENMLDGFAHCQMLYDHERPWDFIYLSVNKAFEDLTGLKDVVGKRVSQVIPGIQESDRELFEIYGRVALTGRPEKFEIYVEALKMWFSISVYSPAKGYFVAVFDVITDRKRAEEEIRRLNVELEKKVVDRTTRLEAANKELEAFTYSVSHDLRAPLRRIDGFSKILMDDYGGVLDEQGKNYLARMRAGSQNMSELIDDLLKLFRLSRSELRRERVNLSRMATTIADSLRAAYPERRVNISVQDGLAAEGDPNLIRTMMENLLDNAWKFTGKNTDARVEFGMTGEAGERVFYVRDNGVGFDMAYVGKLFSPFQRLHSLHEFPGTGIGLATVQRIINRHGGRVWAESSPGNGATFFFKL